MTIEIEVHVGISRDTDFGKVIAQAVAWSMVHRGFGQHGN